MVDVGGGCSVEGRIGCGGEESSDTTMLDLDVDVEAAVKEDEAARAEV